MRTVKQLIYLTLLASTFLSCIDKEEPKTPIDPKPIEQEQIKPELKTFVFKKELNKGLIPFDIVGAIKDKSITVTLDKKLKIKELIPSFTTSDETEVLIKKVKQVSGKTALDITKPVSYTLVSKTKTEATYELKINYITDAATSFTKLSLMKAQNPSLEADLMPTLDDKGNYVFESTSSDTSYIPSFETEAKEVLIGDKKQESGVTLVDFTQPVLYTLISKEGFKQSFTVIVKPKQEAEITIAKLIIKTKDGQEITSKKDYLKASFEFVMEDGKKTYKGKIRGRGNSTWGRPKKPYKIKLKDKESLFGMKAEKKWVLLANHLDPTMMLTATAMKVGEQLEIPYTNHIIPIDVTINGVYRGQYNLTEQVEVKKNRVNVEDGVLLELDTYFDEDYKFKTNFYRLPVNFKYPKDNKGENAQIMAKTEEELNQLESLVASYQFPNNNYLDYFDKEAFVKYLVVQALASNREINHPKSTYMHKPKDGKFTMGPLWDFDWAYGYNSHQHFTTYTQPIFVESNSMAGASFFSRIASDPKVAQLLKETWQGYRAEHFDALLSYLDKYYEDQKASRAKDYEVWHTGSGDFDAEYQTLRTWLINRANFLDQEFNKL